MFLDILIIGGGPIGLLCGLEAKKAGLNYIIIEKGCLVNSLYNYPANMTFFSTSEKIEIGGIPFVSNNIKPLEYYRRVALSNHLKINLFETVISNEPDSGRFKITTNKAVYYAGNVVIATGFYDIPNKLNIPGEDLPKVQHYYKEPHFYALQKVIVVGASNSAVDAALETYRKGAEVTMVVRQKEISNRVKYWVRPDVINRIKEGSIKVFFESNLQCIREHDVDIMTPEGLITIGNDYVLALTGYQPDFAFLKKMGVSISTDDKQLPEYNGDTMETSLNGLYLAGVVCGGMDTHLWFIENSREHAARIINDILHKKKS
jgi:thioredoxin reductase (NADPH)